MDVLQATKRSINCISCGGKFWRNFNLIVWKNLLIRKRHWLITLLELVFPALLFSLSLFFLHSLKKNIDEKLIIQPLIPMTQLIENFSSTNKMFKYLPSNDFTDSLMKTVVKRLGFEMEGKGNWS